MSNLPKILGVVVVIGVVFVGVKWIGSTVDGSEFNAHIENVIGPNQADALMKQSIQKKAAAMGYELAADAIKIEHAAPSQSSGPVASKVPSMKVIHRKTTITVTYSKQIVPGWKQQVTVVKSASYPIQTIAPSRKF